MSESQGAKKRRRLLRPVALVCAVAFFFTPLVARLSGQKAIELENHKLATFPALQSWNFFTGFDQWSIDHLPLRQYAVRGNANLSEALFNQAPAYGGNADTGIAAIGTHAGQKQEDPNPTNSYPRVLQGKDGWMFLGEDASGACETKAPLSLGLARVADLAKAVEASGRRFIFVVAPNKTTIERDKLPDHFYGKDCMIKREDDFWREIRANPPPGFVDLRAPLEKAQREDGKPIYWKTDSHWTSRGAAVFAHQLAAKLDPGLWKDTKVVSTGPAQRQGDLSDLLGTPKTDTSPGWDVQRKGVKTGYTVAPSLPQRPTPIHNTTTDAPLFQPKTMLLGDSFTDTSRRVLYPLFANVTPLHNKASLGFPKTFANTLINSDVVVLEEVERSMLGGGGPSISSPAYRTGIESVLAKHPLRKR
ncbi:MAG TPA: hypothetical protein VHX59_18410 [Mycobacteriales bacterium]|nr:hypothetical protein [Mycobacteriales bacterium]